MFSLFQSGARAFGTIAGGELVEYAQDNLGGAAADGGEFVGVDGAHAASAGGDQSAQVARWQVVGDRESDHEGLGGLAERRPQPDRQRGKVVAGDHGDWLFR
ncbi:hypothetical protein [Nocardia beijingensis]|uniref:hypothetical protein n=1 Tax=Nocardia beijingensis TaxID=95162 RepID=UPI00378C3EED